MPGGAPEAWELVKPIFQGISAKLTLVSLAVTGWATMVLVTS